MAQNTTAFGEVSSRHLISIHHVVLPWFATYEDVIKLNTKGRVVKFGYTLLYVDDVVKTMDFYEKAFGLKKGMSHENQYGEMVTGETKLGFVNHETASSHGFQYERPNLQKDPFAFEIGFTTQDVEAGFRTALSAGAISVCEPKMKPWGQVVSYVRDCNGYLVEICSSM